MNIEQKEIHWYIKTTGGLVDNYLNSIINNLAKKLNKGTFINDKAVKAFYNLVVYAMQDYYKGYKNAKWYELLTVKERYELAGVLLDEYMEQIEEQGGKL